MGPKNSYKCDLTDLLVPLIMLSLNHQNHKQCPRWGHVPYKLKPGTVCCQEGEDDDDTTPFDTTIAYKVRLLLHFYSDF